MTAISNPEYIVHMQFTEPVPLPPMSPMTFFKISFMVIIVMTQNNLEENLSYLCIDGNIWKAEEMIIESANI